MAKPIFIAASPNSERDDVFLAESLSRRPWRWRNPAKVRELEQQVSKFLDHRPAVAFDSARSSLFALLKAYGIGDGDEVIIPGFTCLVVANPIIWTGARITHNPLLQHMPVLFRPFLRFRRFPLLPGL